MNFVRFGDCVDDDCGLELRRTTTGSFFRAKLVAGRFVLAPACLVLLVPARLVLLVAGRLVLLVAGRLVVVAVLLVLGRLVVVVVLLVVVVVLLIVGRLVIVLVVLLVPGWPVVVDVLLVLGGLVVLLVLGRMVVLLVVVDVLVEGLAPRVTILKLPLAGHGSARSVSMMKNTIFIVSVDGKFWRVTTSRRARTRLKLATLEQRNRLFERNLTLCRRKSAGQKISTLATRIGSQGLACTHCCLRLKNYSNCSHILASLLPLQQSVHFR